MRSGAALVTDTRRAVAQHRDAAPARDQRACRTDQLRQRQQFDVAEPPRVQ